MITRDNLKAVLNDITPKNVWTEQNKEGDYFLLEIHIFNVGSFATLESKEYNEEEEQEANDNGQLFIDKDQFFEILKETTGREF